MERFLLYFVISTFSAHYCRGLADSYGTVFDVIAPKNSRQATSKFSLFMSNPFLSSAYVTITYPVITSPNNREISVEYKQIFERIGIISGKLVTLDSRVMLESRLDAGFGKTLDIRIRVESDMKIGLIAISEETGGKMDIFTVYPTSMASKRYTLSLPASCAGTSAEVFFMPIEDNVVLNLTVVTSTSRTPISTVFTEMGQYPASSVAYVSLEGTSLWMLVESTKYFSVMAYAQCVCSSGISDFAAYMPLPLKSTEGCREAFYLDYYDTPKDEQDTSFALLSESHLYMPVSSADDCNQQTPIVAMYSNSSVNKDMQTSKKRTNGARLPDSVQNMGNETRSKAVAFTPDYGNAKVLRLGGYNITNSKDSGIYIDELPQRRNFISGECDLFVFKAGDRISVFADENAMKRIQMGGIYLRKWEKFTGNFENEVSYSIYYTTIVAEYAGHQTFKSKGEYLVSVTGFANGTAYGYTPAVKSTPNTVVTNVATTVADVSTTITPRKLSTLATMSTSLPPSTKRPSTTYRSGTTTKKSCTSVNNALHSIWLLTAVFYWIP